jgi:hypothetical protein
MRADRLCGRERLRIAMTGGVPDRVPVAPDLYAMVPCRLTGKPFWKVFVDADPPLWRACIDAYRYYGVDGWFIHGDLAFRSSHQLTVDRSVESGPDGRSVRTVYHTPDGDLAMTTSATTGDPPVDVERIIKDFRVDFPKLKHLFADVVGCDPSRYREQRQALGDDGLAGLIIGSPGLQLFSYFMQGGVEAATYALYDHPDLFDELVAMYHRQCVRQAEMAIEAGVDSICTGGSGSLTLQSEQLWRRFSLPTIREVARRCRQAGVICGIHSCGRERALVLACAQETEVDYVNPLETAPMGDCDLAELRRQVGGTICLMGNLHALRDAGAGGGFVLSTGDQCGRDTPDGNIRAMVRASREFGVYPLDLGRIDEAINGLEEHPA